MARARNIKPSFFVNEDLVELDFSTRLLFIGLWTMADREGRLEDRPLKIKMTLFPGDNIDIDKALSDLCAKRFLRRYEIENINVIQIVNFSKHQKPHHQEKKSELPKEQISDESRTTSHQGANHFAPFRPDSLNTDSLNTDSLNTDSSGSDKSKPVKKIKNSKVLDFSDWPEIPDNQIYEDWEKLRRSKKASVTQTVINRFGKELTKASEMGFSVNECLETCCLRAWQGFEAEWMVRNSTGPPNSGPIPPISQHNIEVGRSFLRRGNKNG